MPPSLREALSSAVEKEETSAAAAPVEVPAQAESTPDSSPGGESSLEAASAVTPESPGEATPDKAAAPAVDDKPAAEVKPTDVPPEGQDAAAKAAAETARQHRIDRPPASWKKEAKGEWAALPLHIRQEVHKRESEINRTLAQVAPDRQLAEQFKQTVTPYLGMVKARGLDPLQATANLFEADLRLSTGTAQSKAEFLAQLIMDYGIDIQTLDSALSPLVHGPQAQAQAQQPAGADIAAIVQQQLNQALAPIMQERKAAEQRQRQEVEHTVESMAVDPKYPFFEDVREDMADLIDIAARKGVALSLEDAYARAVRMNPDTYGQLERQSTVSQATQAHQAAIRAKNAGSSISGAPAGGGGQFNSGDGSLRGAIEAAFGGQRL